MEYELILVDQKGEPRRLPVVVWLRSESGAIALVDYGSPGRRAHLCAVPFDLDPLAPVDGKQPSYLTYAWGFVAKGNQIETMTPKDWADWRRERDRIA